MEAPSSTNKSRLRDFYNKKQASKNKQINQNYSKDDTFDKNKACFDSSAYFNNLIAKNNLNELMDEEASLIREVKQYDSDMQNLVMENYNKFIMATDTIGRMKVKFQEMESKVLKLSSDIKSINKNAKEIGVALQPNREKLSKLVNVQTALNQLQFIFSLPTSLQEYIEQKEYTAAYDLYMQSKPALEKYRNHPSFEKTVIHIDILVGKLQKNIFDENIVSIFDEAGQGGSGTLLNSRDPAKITELAIAASQYIDLNKGTTDLVPIKDILNLAKNNLKVEQELANFSEENEQILSNLLEKFDTIIMLLNNITNLHQSKELTIFCKNFFTRVCDFLEKYEERQKQQQTESSKDFCMMTDKSVYMIRKIYERLINAGDSPNLPPEVQTQELAERLTIIKVKQILNTFDMSLGDWDICSGTVVEEGNENSISYSEIRRTRIDNIITNLKDFSKLWSFGQTMTDDPILEMEYFKHGKFYENILETIVIKPFTKILETGSGIEVLSLNSTACNSKNNDLQLSRFAHDLANSDLDTISDTANTSLEVFTPWNGGVPELISKFKIYCRSQSTLILSNWILNCGDEALSLLDGIDTLHGNTSTNIKDNKPKVNLAWCEIFKLISENVDEVAKYYTAGSGTQAKVKKAHSQNKGSYLNTSYHVGHSSNRSGTHETGSSIHSNDNSLPGNMNRLFSERVEVLPRLLSVGRISDELFSQGEESSNINDHYLPDSNLIILTLLKYIIKGAIEIGRLTMFVNLHQTQFDIFCVRDFIRRNFSRKDISDDNGLKQLLDDWLNSCMVRSEDPSLLEDSALEFLLHRNR